MLDLVKKGGMLKIDLASGQLTNKAKGVTAQAQPLLDYVVKILESGGIKPLIKAQYGNKE
jgi:3-isopropylmalate/(R)-2-methylmalate dehydratase small subunit